MHLCEFSLLLVELDTAVLTIRKKTKNSQLLFYPNCLCFCAKQDRKYFTFPPLDLFVDGGGRTIHVLRHRKNYRKENKA